MATVRFIGAAQDIQQVTTYTITGTWAANDTCSLKINNKVLTLTLGTDVATTDVAAELAAMINARSATGGRTGANADEVRNFGGQEIAEWTEVVATASSSVLTIKSTAGVPVTITCTQTTAGNGAIESATDGTFKAGTTVTAATGKHFFNNADNWEGGSLPSNNDTILFDQGDVDVKYGLNNTTIGLNLIRKNGYTGNIGLLATNSLGYVEYRQRFLDLPQNGVSPSTHYFGDMGSLVSPRGWTQINFGTTDSAITIHVYDSPANNSSIGEAIKINGGLDIALTMWKGSISLGADPTASPTRMVLSTQPKLVNSADSHVRFGSNLTFASIMQYDIYNGSVWFEGDVPDDVNIHGGVAYLSTDSSSGENITVYSGGLLNVYRSGGSWDLVTIYSGGTINVLTAETSFGGTSIVLHKGGTLNDPYQNLNFTGNVTLNPT